MPMKQMSAMSSMSLKNWTCARGDCAMSCCMRCSGHVMLFRAEIARDAIHSFISIANNEHKRVIVVCNIASRGNGQGAQLNVEVVALVS